MRPHDNSPIATSSPRPRIAGFTILELIVALTVGALVISGARLLLDALSTAAMRLAGEATVNDHRANGERWLRRVVYGIETGTTPGGTFGGDSSSSHFISWCLTPAAWYERCRISLRVVADDTLHGLSAVTSRGDSLMPLLSQHAVSLRYLLTPEQGGIWAKTWSDGPSTPRALGIIAGADTMILRLGEP